MGKGVVLAVSVESSLASHLSCSFGGIDCKRNRASVYVKGWVDLWKEQTRKGLTYLEYQLDYRPRAHLKHDEQLVFAAC